MPKNISAAPSVADVIRGFGATFDFNRSRATYNKLVSGFFSWYRSYSFVAASMFPRRS